MIDLSWGKRRAIFRRVLLVVVTTVTMVGAADVAAQTRVTTWGLTAPGDARGLARVRAGAARVDAAVDGWIQIDSLTGLPSLVSPDSTARSALAPSMALVTSWQGQRFHPEMIRRLANDRGALALTAARIAALASSNGYRGIIIDVENQSREDLPATVRLVAAIGDSVRRHGVETVAIALPAADTMGYPTRAFFPHVDFVMVMLVDEHGPTSAPGPVASPEWVRRMLAQRVADVGAARIVAALPLYGYLWRQNQPAVRLGFDDARRAAAEAAVDLRRDPALQSLHAVKLGDWDLWMTDAVLLRALRDEVTALGVNRIALFGLGLEDPAAWTVFTR